MAAGDSDTFSNVGETFVICPTCKGKGYCEGNQLSRKNYSSPNGLFVPKISSPKKVATPVSKTPQVKGILDNRIPLLPNKMCPVPTRCMSPASSRSNLKPSANLLKPGSRGSMSETSEMVVDLIGHEEVDNPLEYVKIIKARLVSKEWSDRMIGLQGAVYLSRTSPEIAVEIGREICRTILDELNSLRSRCVRIACQAAKELFLLGSEFVYRPVFDEIVNVLLGRAADSKRVIREDADDALMAIATHCPLQHVARAFSKGPKHKHQLVRKCALRVLKVLINRVGVPMLIKNFHYRELRNTLLEAGCILLDDPIAEIRNTAKEIMTPIVQMPEFEIVIQDVDTKYLKKVENILFKLKYKIEER